MGLKEQTIKGVAWTSVGTVGSGLLNLLVTIVLARLLTPQDFGIIELLVVFSGLSDIIVDSGFSQAVIKDNTATDKDLSSVFWLNFLIAVVIYLVLFLAAPFIAKFYGSPIMANLARVVFLTIIFNSLSVIQNANLSRKLSFKPYALASLSAIIVSGPIAIILAIVGFGVWALAINLVVFSFIRMCVLWCLSGWYPKFLFSVYSVKRYFSFGINLLLQGLLDKLCTNLESLIIGKIYTKQQLGYFSQGRRLDSYITQATSSIVSKVVYPVLAKVQNNESKLKEGYKTIVGIVTCCMSPVMAIMFTGSEFLMNGIFGHQWIAAAPYLRLWSICGWMLLIYSVFVNIFLVKGKSRLLLQCSIIKQILRVVVVFVFVNISIMHMMYGIVAITILTGFMYIYVGGRLIQYSIIDLFKDIKGSLFSIVIAAITAYFLTPRIVHDNGIIALLVLSSITMFVYLGLLIIQKNNSLISIKSIIFKK